MTLSTTRLTYDEWLATVDTDWMTANGFFMGCPLNTTDAPVDIVARAAVYSYIADKYGDRKLGMLDPDKWTKKFRAKLVAVNGSFWKQWQMDQLVRVKDLVTADFQEFTQNYNRGSSKQRYEHTGTSLSKGKVVIDGENNTDPIETTTLDTTKEGDVSVTFEPTAAAQTVHLNSSLAESTYAGDGVPGTGEGGSKGMPLIDTSHGDNVSSNWELSEASTETTERQARSGSVINNQGAIKVTNKSNQDNASSSSDASADFTRAINDSIGGTMSEGFHDFNGYNLKASIEAVQELLPYEFLDAAVAPLFYAIVDLWEEE